MALEQFEWWCWQVLQSIPAYGTDCRGRAYQVASEFDLLAHRRWFSNTRGGRFFCWSMTRREDIAIVPMNWPFDEKQDEPLLFRSSRLMPYDRGGVIFKRNAWDEYVLYGVLCGTRGDLFVGAPVPRSLVRRAGRPTTDPQARRLLADAKHLVSMHQLAPWARYRSSSEVLYVVCGMHGFPIAAEKSMEAANAVVDAAFRTAHRCTSARGSRRMWIARLKPGTPLDWSAVILCTPSEFEVDVLL